MKRAEKLFDAITDVRDDLVEDAQEYRFQRRAILWRRYVNIAACMVLVVGVTFLFRFGFLGGMGGSNSAGNTTGDSAPPMDSGNTGGAADGAVPGDGAAGGAADFSFTDYAGPILPLAARGDMEHITAQRELTLDLSGYGQVEGERWEDRFDAAVTDRYLLTNSGIQEQTLTLLYPTAASYETYHPVELWVDGAAMERTVHAGPWSGSVSSAGELLTQLDSAEDYQLLLKDEAYMAAALAGYSDLTDVPVTVYELTDIYVPGQVSYLHREITDPALKVSFSFSENTTVHYSGFKVLEEDDGRASLVCKATESDSPMLIVIGEDITQLELQGYFDDSCNAGEEVAEITAAAERRESDLDAVMRPGAETFWQSRSEGTFELFYDSVRDLVRHYGLSKGCGVLEKIFNDIGSSYAYDTWRQDRVFWTAAEVTIPAGATVEVCAIYDKAASLNYGPNDMPEKDVSGYDVLLAAESALTFTSQTARLLGTEVREIVWDDFGFTGSNAAALSGEYYCLKVR